VFSELGAETALRSRPPGVDKKILVVAVAVCSAAPPKARRRRLRRKIKLKKLLVKLLLLQFALQRLNLWNPARGRGKLLKMFPTLRFKRLLVWRT
jgi:hypothetical protein